MASSGDQLKITPLQPGRLNSRPFFREREIRLYKGNERGAERVFLYIFFCFVQVQPKALSPETQNYRAPVCEAPVWCEM